MNNKTAVITGGTRGIGASLVADFLRQGWNVSYSGTNQKTIDSSLANLSGKFQTDCYSAYSCDIRIENDIKSLWENASKKFGKIDIWVNNAGKANDKELFPAIASEEINSIIDINVKGLMIATKIVYNKMLEQGTGAIYNLAGLGSDGRIIKGFVPYGTSKRAVQYFTKAFSKEVKGGPVIIGILYPGMVVTELILSQLGKDPSKDKLLKKVFNTLANDPEQVTPYLVRKMIENKRNGKKISFFKKRVMIFKILTAPFSRRDVISRHLNKSNKS